MTAPIDRILEEVRELDRDERAVLAMKIIESLDVVEPAGEVEKAWNQEAARCLAEFDAGRMPTVSSDELHTAIRAEFRS